jgi:lipid-A-disaccharide synthase
MPKAQLKIAIIAGEASGDFLGAGLINALKERRQEPLTLIGVGGPALAAEGLQSLFDYSELSIMGFSAVLARLPNLLARIKQTANTIIAEKPDLLIIVDSPDFTHRVARKVRKALPDLPVVNYVCPSVWAWKSYRAREMTSYVDHVLAILPFEPEVMRILGGPETTFVGHRLTGLPALLAARSINSGMPAKNISERRTILLLPGSRSTEISRLLPVMMEIAELLSGRGAYEYLLPTVPHQEARIRGMLEGMSIKPDLLVGETEKWRAFSKADAAIAASGTVILELALAGVPTVSLYKTDLLFRMLAHKVKIWSAALPNLIVDFPIVAEFLNEAIRPGAICRHIERLSSETPQRAAMRQGYDEVFAALHTDRPSSHLAADAVVSLLDTKKPGYF